jgi:outer membrane protein assembly factor BamB
MVHRNLPWAEFPKIFAIAVLFLLPGLGLAVPMAGAVDISDTPLDTRIQTPAPLVMFVWDDSDSMDREFMTAEPDGLFAHRYYLFQDEAYMPGPDHNDGRHRDLGEAQRRMWRSQWSGENRIYFNPRRTYLPWPGTDRFTFGSADPNNPFSDPTRTGPLNARLRLSAEFFSVRSAEQTITIPNAHYFTVKDSNGNMVPDSGESVYLIAWQDADGDQRLDLSNRLDHDQRRYFRYQDDGDDVVEDNELTLVLSDAEKDDLRPAILDSRGNVQRLQTDAEELQNFANWFTYHRRREFAAKAVVASAIRNARQCYIGIYAINGGPRLGVRPVRVTGSPVEGAGGQGDPVSATTLLDQSESLLDALYQAESSGQTHLRQALDQVGRYFDHSQASTLGAAPWFSAEQGGPCQRSYTIVLSDGFWNGLFSGVGNADGGQGAPYADGWSDTLADIAMYYYRKDLSPGLADHVPVHGCDDAVHQHMVTHALSFGVNGSIVRQDIDNDGRPDAPGYREDPCFELPNTPRPAWPQPSPGLATTVDDLWHAAVNGRGLYLNADDPEALNGALAQILDIIGASASAAGVAVSGSALSDPTVVYQSRYRADDWSGDLLAFAIDADSGAVDDRPEHALWSAAAQLMPTATSYDERRIVTYGGPWRDPQGVPFRYDALSTSQKQALGADPTPGSSAEQSARQLLDYLRGRAFAQYRPRSSLLGDVVHATPVLAGQTLFVGANDGMLHAFDARTGAERFAYVPNLVFKQLPALAAPDYASHHQFYVDATPYVGEVVEDLYQRRSYLVGCLGKGGKGCYGLLVESRQREPAGAGFGAYQTHFSVDDIGFGSSEQDLGSIVLWEYPRPDQETDDMDNDGDGLLDETGEEDGDIGYGFGQAYVVNANTRPDAYRTVVIFGNGYNSSNGHAVLYILDASKGSLVRKIDTGVAQDNGLSEPALIDVNLDRCVDYVYAGDLKGNLWKFDLTAHDPAGWGVAYGEDRNGDGVIDAAGDDLPLPLFASPNQPVTGRPDVMAMSGACGPELPGNMVIFGTGRYLGEADRHDVSPQSIYGIWDFGDDSDDSEHLGHIVERATGRLSSGLALARREVVSQLSQEGTLYRQLSEWRADYPTVSDKEDGDRISANNGRTQQAVDPSEWAGWFFDFPVAPDPLAEPGERVTGRAVLRGGKAVMLSFAPRQAPCDCGGASWRYLLDGCGDSPSPPGGNNNALLAKRFGTRLNDAMVILKRASAPHLDQVLCSDLSGRIVAEEIEGERWGKVYWRHYSDQ